MDCSLALPKSMLLERVYMAAANTLKFVNLKDIETQKQMLKSNA